MLKLLIIAGAMTLGMATAASAETPCKGAAPAPGAVLHGPVLHVEDGGRLCVARGFDIESWVEVQLADAQPAAVFDVQHRPVQDRARRGGRALARGLGARGRG
ncbi:MAG: hypothetical protein ACM3W4_03580, partial [Ignavibacteriales bacterium]